MTDTVQFERIALIGVGLIGSSLARAIRAKGLARTTVAYSRTSATRERVAALGIVDEVLDDPARAADGADLVVIGVPVGASGEVAAALAPGLGRGAVVTDVGSVKGAVIAAVTPHLPEGVPFVPGHPIAGTEHSGPDAGFAELFEGRWCVLTPTEDTDPEAVERVAAMWRAAGSTVDLMSAQHHDTVLAITSHIPHLIAYNIVSTVVDLEERTKKEVIKYAAGGFRDFTRIAASDPVMWRDVFLTNRDAVLEMLATFNEDLARLQRAIRRNEGEELERIFTETRDVRRGVIAANQA
jgi:cyclohexadieny/prephenate dehydrogenase